MTWRANPHMQSQLRHCNCPWHKVSPRDIQLYAHSVEEALSSIVVSDNLLICCDLSCLSHQLKLDLIWSAIVKCRHVCASNTVPKPCSKRKVAGWDESVKPQKIKADLWYKIWRDAGCPASRVLFEIKKKTESRYKYSARRTLRQQNRLHSERMAHALIDNDGLDFWSEIRRINCKPTSVPPSVDGTTGNKPIRSDSGSLNILKERARSLD